MRFRNTTQPARYALALFAALALAGSRPATSQTSKLKDLHSFSVLSAGYTNSDGASPDGGVIQGKDGNLYGTTDEGGVNGVGTVFKMTTAGKFTSLYSFSPLSGTYPGPYTNSDGAHPSAGLIQATDGSLYGTCLVGGASGAGTIYKITTSGVLTPLHSFSQLSSIDSGSNADGANPNALIQAGDGNLYGTSYEGGANGVGTIFKITTGSAFTTLYSFSALNWNGSDWSNSDGARPVASLIQARDGDLYGTCSLGGANGNGTIFKLTISGKLSTLYSLSAYNNPPYTTNADGATPNALIQAGDGGLYGTTLNGGVTGLGTVFKITTGGAFTLLHALDESEGAAEPGDLIQAADGNLFGTTWSGPRIFSVTTSGAWTSLHAFQSKDGSFPTAALIQAADGNLYGTCSEGGVYGQGTIFRLSGVYPVPALASISPTSANAAGPAVALKVKGSDFQTFSHVNWNGVPLTTTYVSPTELTAAVPTSLIAAPGKAIVTVVTGAGGGTSGSKPFTLLATTLKLKVAKLTRDSGKNTLTAVVTLFNAGYLLASSTSVTQATLNGAAATNLPQSVGSIAAGGTGTATLVFPGSAGSSGQKVALLLSGTFSGGTFSGNLTVKLP